MRKLLSAFVVLALFVGCAAIPVWAQGKPDVKGAAAQASAQASATAKAKLLDINSASKEELMKLPGIGEAYSNKIIQNRPYKGKDDLVKKNLIPQATYDKIKDLIIAKQK